MKREKQSKDARTKMITRGKQNRTARNRREKNNPRLRKQLVIPPRPMGRISKTQNREQKEDTKLKCSTREGAKIMSAYVNLVEANEHACVSNNKNEK